MEIQQQNQLFVLDEKLGDESVIARLGRTLGYAIREFSDEDQMLEAVNGLTGSAGRVCLMIDVNAPRGTGLGIMARLNRCAFAAPVVFVTIEGNAPADVNDHGVTFVAKPLGLAQFRDAVENAFLYYQDLARITEAGNYFELLSRLKDQERRIVELAAEGVPNKRIASIMGFSVKTIEKHRRRAYDALEVRSTAEMARAVTMASLYRMLNAVSRRRTLHVDRPHAGVAPPKNYRHRDQEATSTMNNPYRSNSADAFPATRR